MDNLIVHDSKAFIQELMTFLQGVSCHTHHSLYHLWKESYVSSSKMTANKYNCRSENMHRRLGNVLDVIRICQMSCLLNDVMVMGLIYTPSVPIRINTLSGHGF